MNRIMIVLLTGNPGVGKTTLIKKACEKLNRLNVKLDGFYTEELRDASNIRRGFDVVCLDGKREKLARSINHIESDKVTKYRVGQYCVYPKEFEELVLPLFTNPTDILVIDEIGKMELISDKFKKAVMDAVKKKSVSILGTVPAPNKRPNVVKDIIDMAENCTIINVDYKNRDRLLEGILSYFV